MNPKCLNIQHYEYATCIYVYYFSSFLCVLIFIVDNIPTLLYNYAFWLEETAAQLLHIEGRREQRELHFEGRTREQWWRKEDESRKKSKMEIRNETMVEERRDGGYEGEERRGK